MSAKPKKESKELAVIPAVSVTTEVLPPEESSDFPITAAKQERIDELVAEIRELHTDILNLNSSAEELVCNKANAMRAAGQMLAELKEHTKHGGFVKLFKSGHGKANVDPVLHFDYSTARNYMRFAKHWSERPLVIEDVKGKKTLTEVQVASGSLTPKTKSGEKLHTIPTVTEIFINFQMDWNEALNAARKIQDDREWDRDTCEKVKRQLQPIVDFFNSL